MVRSFVLSLLIFCSAWSHAQNRQSFNTDWEFVKDIDTVFNERLQEKSGGIGWERITLPHTASIEPIQKVKQHWQGTCFYRKYFTLPVSDQGKHVAIQFDAAMQVADVYLNGEKIMTHVGGYLPFYIDVSDRVLFGKENVIVVRLNNEDNPEVPPGKPLDKLDFNYYSGLYRNAWLIVKDKLYISNAVAANRTAGGGVLLYYDNVTTSSATLVVKAEIKNDRQNLADARVRITLADKANRRVAEVLSEKQSVKAGAYGTFAEKIVITNPQLWSPDHPYLYFLTVELLDDGHVIDKETMRTGVKSVRIQRDGLYLNGKKTPIRGTNRHQDYPYVGNAVSDNAQYRDAYKIKMAGFNFVRSSHYPQSPAFLDACDELGLMVMDAIPGWQFAGNEVFQKNSFQDTRDMIRRDRHHASIILWEASLNESGMSKAYMETAHKIVHDELPFDGVYSAGWINDVYDVFLPARQHAKPPDYWKKHDDERPLFIAEYGDWEYYAQNAGFNQAEFKDLKEEERTSRQLRGFGEKRLLQQALNYQEAHNDNLRGTGLGDANWLMFDYNRGYADDIESSGISDMTRLPKFSFYFYQSQADPVVKDGTAFNKPMLYIANYWQPNSSTDVRVFSNCDEVELFLNGKSLGKRKPDTDDFSTHLKHPPFTFSVSSFQPGELKAIGYIENKKVVEHKRETPGEPVAIRLWVDYSGRALMAGQNDMVFVYSEVIDRKGTVVTDASNQISFSVSGDAAIISPENIAAEAGIGTILLKAGASPGNIVVTASGAGLKSAEIKLVSK